MRLCRHPQISCLRLTSNNQVNQVNQMQPGYWDARKALTCVNVQTKGAVEAEKTNKKQNKLQKKTENNTGRQQKHRNTQIRSFRKTNVHQLLTAPRSPSDPGNFHREVRNTYLWNRTLRKSTDSYTLIHGVCRMQPSQLSMLNNVENIY